MKIPELSTIKTEDQARELALDWQIWAAEQNQIGEEPTLFTSDLVEWQNFFEKLAAKFNLTDEFKENSII